MTMADLAQVRVRARVDETDIGKIAPGMAGRHQGRVVPRASASPARIEKIEPQAVVEQNVTLFPGADRAARTRSVCCDPA